MKVSVVMACRDSNPSLLEMSIMSVLKQTYSSFEFIIVDDGSIIPIENVIRRFTDDSRITIYRIENSGLGAALNYGINKSSGKYIARLDDDDIMCSKRLQKQVDYLDTHKEVSCVGTQNYDKVEKKYLSHRRYPTDHKKIINDLLRLKWAMAHTTLMFRKDCFEKIGGYRIKGGGQDLDLFIQFGTIGKLANIDEFLVFYTLSKKGISVVNKKKYDAYLFALNDVKERDLYPEYRSIVDKSINALHKFQVKNNSNRISKYKRSLMIFKVQFLGKNFLLKNE